MRVTQECTEGCLVLSEVTVREALEGSTIVQLLLLGFCSPNGTFLGPVDSAAQTPPTSNFLDHSTATIIYITFVYIVLPV